MLPSTVPKNRMMCWCRRMQMLRTLGHVTCRFQTETPSLEMLKSWQNETSKTLLNWSNCEWLFHFIPIATHDLLSIPLEPCVSYGSSIFLARWREGVRGAAQGILMEGSRQAGDQIWIASQRQNRGFRHLWGAWLSGEMGHRLVSAWQSRKPSLK